MISAYARTNAGRHHRDSILLHHHGQDPLQLIREHLLPGLGRQLFAQRRSIQQTQHRPGAGVRIAVGVQQSCLPVQDEILMSLDRACDHGKSGIHRFHDVEGQPLAPAG